MFELRGASRLARRVIEECQLAICSVGLTFAGGVQDREKTMIRKSLYEAMVVRGPDNDCESRTMLVLAEDKQDAERLVGGDCRVVAVRHNGGATRAVGLGASSAGAGTGPARSRPHPPTYSTCQNYSLIDTR